MVLPTGRNYPIQEDKSSNNFYNYDTFIFSITFFLNYLMTVKLFAKSKIYRHIAKCCKVKSISMSFILDCLDRLHRVYLKIRKKGKHAVLVFQMLSCVLLYLMHRMMVEIDIFEYCITRIVFLW